MSIGLIRAMGVTVAVLLVASCDEPPPRALFTVNYYKTHENDRHERLKQCQADPAQAKTPDCVNATQAESSAEAEGSAQTVAN
jgi:hypothetical protein